MCDLCVSAKEEAWSQMDRGLDAAALPPGVAYISDVLSREEEQAINDRLDAGEWSNTLKRRVQHFGYLYDYRARTVTADAYLGDLPAWLETGRGTIGHGRIFHGFARPGYRERVYSGPRHKRPRRLCAVFRRHNHVDKPFVPMRDDISGTVWFQIACRLAPSTLGHLAEGCGPI